MVGILYNQLVDSMNWPIKELRVPISFHMWWPEHGRSEIGIITKVTLYGKRFVFYIILYR